MVLGFNIFMYMCMHFNMATNINASRCHKTGTRDDTNDEALTEWRFFVTRHCEVDRCAATTGSRTAPGRAGNSPQQDDRIMQWLLWLSSPSHLTTLKDEPHATNYTCTSDLHVHVYTVELVNVFKQTCTVCFLYEKRVTNVQYGTVRQCNVSWPLLLL